MREFCSYLKERRRLIGVLALFALMYIVAFALYRLPLGAAAYPTALCLALGGIALGWDYARVRRRHRQLGAIRDAIDAHLLPPPGGLLEADYQALLHRFQESEAKQRTAMDRGYRDRMDYFTLWAHQAKTPIASIRLNLQNEDSPLARQLRGDVTRLEQYVDMALVYLRLDSESSDYVIKAYPLDDILRPAVRRFAGEFILRRLKLTYLPLETEVITDEKWLCFVVEQVLSNALKYTPSGGIHIYLERPKTLCIRDTGIGIEAEDLPRIFEKGYTGGNGRTDNRSTGIGLYLCRRICGNLGHRIWATSVPDQGTIIHIDLSRRELRPE